MADRFAELVSTVSALLHNHGGIISTNSILYFPHRLLCPTVNGQFCFLCISVCRADGNDETLWLFRNCCGISSAGNFANLPSRASNALYSNKRHLTFPSSALFVVAEIEGRIEFSLSISIDRFRAGSFNR